MNSDPRRVVVLAALPEEASALESNDRLEVVVCGIGKVAAAIGAQRACDVMAPRALISIGLAGGVDSESEPGRLIVASSAVQHDYDARPVTSSRGSQVFTANADVVERLAGAASAAVEDPRLVRTGMVLTGDQVIRSKAVRDEILGDFPDGACFDMETAAVAQVALANQVPWGAVRITSDAADENFNLDAVLGFCATTASQLFTKILNAFVVRAR
jgi:5'-methylthioadenosine/S-adenosylhomocysteine nucleosidase